jgi:hypothetical protein
MTPTATASYAGPEIERSDAGPLSAPPLAPPPAELWGIILAGGEGVRVAVTTLTGVTWCDWGSPRRVVESLERLGIRPPWLDRLTEPVGAGSEK